MCVRTLIAMLLSVACTPVLSAELRPWEVFELELTAQSETPVGYVKACPMVVPDTCR